MIQSKNNKSLAQLAIQERFKLACKVVKPLMPFLQVTYRNKAKRNRRLKPHNVAIAQVIKQAIVGLYPDMRVDYAKLLLSDGIYAGLSNVQLSVSGLEIRLQHERSTAVNRKNKDDIVIWVVYCPTLEECISVEGVRYDDHLSVTIPQWFINHDLHHYLIVCRRDYSLFSTSQYLGKS